MIKDLCRKYEFSVLILLETRINGERANEVIRKLDFDGVCRVEANGFIGGIWTLWDAMFLNVNILCTTS